MAVSYAFSSSFHLSLSLCVCLAFLFGFLSVGRSVGLSCACNEQDASSHDGDWRHYKQQAYVQKDIISQLASLLETYGYHLPRVSWLRRCDGGVSHTYLFPSLMRCGAPHH